MRTLLLIGTLFISSLLLSCEIEPTELNKQPQPAPAAPQQYDEQEQRIDAETRTNSFKKGKYPEFTGAILEELEKNLKKRLSGKLPAEDIERITVDDPRIIKILEDHADYLVAFIGSQEINYDSLRDSASYRSVFH